MIGNHLWIFESRGDSSCVVVKLDWPLAAEGVYCHMPIWFSGSWEISEEWFSERDLRFRMPLVCGYGSLKSDLSGRKPSVGLFQRGDVSFDVLLQFAIEKTLFVFLVVKQDVAYAAQRVVVIAQFVTQGGTSFL